MIHLLNKCCVCGRTNGQAVTMIGDYYTVLCLDDRNEFELFASKDDSILKFHRRKAETEIYAMAGQVEDALATYEFLQELKMKAFHISRDWVEDRKLKKVEAGEYYGQESD